MLMSKKRKLVSGIIFAVLLVALLVGIVLTGPGGEEEPIKEVMKDAVLHEHGKVSLFGLINVNPGLISAFTVTGIFLVFGLVVRIFFIPRFTRIPGKFQMLLESAVGIFENLAGSNSPHRNGFLGAYVFAAGAYIFVGTIFELFGIQVPLTNGGVIALPAPLADINGAIAMGVMSYLIIMSGGIAGNGVKGVFLTLKDFSLPISMSFRLFGALLSGALVTELVYYYLAVSFVVPVLVGVMFTMLHALIQAYVLTMLVALFYGEVSETAPKKVKVKKNKKNKNIPEVE
ncbi:MAG: F0F1 ATP synthase subunit A [Lachnospiraceae bacterium]|nr:F0F1 ATP synthase subunit A [Lachnospiraceae bacterium]